MYKVTLRVVETMGDKRSRFNSMEGVKNWVTELFTQITGGVTVGTETMGYWRDERGTVIAEMGVDLYTLAESKNQVAQLREVGRDLKGLTGQDCILFMVEEVKGEFL